ncbi:hypothetical protein P4V41_12930 [Fictibacillus nanhaiensis]|uniref:hypothetical protein n=1 Tax=Fictibacillus nanhaiensis TaxID=742169 RepID=UPI002E1A3D6C|nr:hypothetical protein [Fictibacillus nanhaiensis]
MSKWKPQEFTTEDRLQVANEIFDTLLSKYNEQLISVAILNGEIFEMELKL